MFANRFEDKKVGKALLLLFFFLCNNLLSVLTLQPAVALQSDGENVALKGVDQSLVKQQYSEITKKILLSGIELERFSLHFRQESAKQPKFRRLRYFLTQETGAACGLAFEITADKEFARGRRRPLQISKHHLRGALATAMTGSIIAGSGSCLELSSNIVRSVRNKRNGFDHKTANKFVAGKLKDMDLLLNERDALVSAHSDYDGYEAALLEGKILRQLRNCFIEEYSHFNADTAGYNAYQNVFYLLNATYNAVGAAGAGVAYKAVKTPELNGPANILFIVSGAMAAVSPLISSAAGKFQRNHAEKSFAKQIGEKPAFDAVAFAADCKKLGMASPSLNGTIIPSLPATERLALYTESGSLFRKQLDSETIVMRRLEKVALQNSLLGPVIGAQLMTQGILGTVGYYRYTVQPRKQISMFYRGSIVGTVGTSMATVGNAVAFLSTLSYEHKLSKQKKLPSQLIDARLEHLEEIEAAVKKI